MWETVYTIQSHTYILLLDLTEGPSGQLRQLSLYPQDIPLIIAVTEL